MASLLARALGVYNRVETAELNCKIREQNTNCRRHVCADLIADRRYVHPGEDPAPGLADPRAGRFEGAQEAMCRTSASAGELQHRTRALDLE